MNGRAIMTVSALSLAAAAPGCSGAANTSKKAADASKYVSQAKLPLADAIARATAEVPGGVAVKAELEEHGRVVYSVDVAQGNKVLEFHVDAADGQIVAREEENEDRSREASAKVTLAQAVAAAGAARGGQAVAAEIERKGDGLIVEVKLVNQGSTGEVVVDAATGAVIAEGKR